MDDTLNELDEALEKASTAENVYTQIDTTNCSDAMKDIFDDAKAALEEIKTKATTAKTKATEAKAALPKANDTVYLAASVVDQNWQNEVLLNQVAVTKGQETTGENTTPTTKAVEAVALDTTSITLKEGKTYQLTAQITPADATNTKVTFTSADPKIATVSESGVVKAIKPGTTKITVTTEDGQKTAECKVKVPGVEVSEKSLVVQKGKTNKNIEVTLINDKVKSVTSKDKKIATASVEKGNLYVKGVKIGKTEIIIKTRQGLTAKLKVTVQKDKVTTETIKVSISKLTIKKGKKATLTVSSKPDYASTKEKIKYYVSKKGIIKVKINQETGEVKITGKKKGEVKLRFKVGGVKKSLKVKVK